MTCEFEEPLLTSQQVADYLGVKEGTLRAWRSQSRGPYFVRLGEGQRKPVRYPLLRLHEFIAAGGVTAIETR